MTISLLSGSAPKDNLVFGYLNINFNETKKINLYLSEELSFLKELLADLDHDIHEIENFINKE